MLDYINYLYSTTPNEETINSISWDIAKYITKRETFNLEEVFNSYGIFDSEKIDSAFEYTMKLFNEYENETIDTIYDLLYLYISQIS